MCEWIDICIGLGELCFCCLTRHFFICYEGINLGFHVRSSIVKVGWFSVRPHVIPLQLYSHTLAFLLAFTTTGNSPKARLSGPNNKSGDSEQHKESHRLVHNETAAWKFGPAGANRLSVQTYRSVGVAELPRLQFLLWEESPGTVPM